MKTATFLITLSFFLSVSCTSNAGLGEPPKLFYGEDVCDECGMIISDRRFASGYTTKQGISRKFDDIGGMSVFLKKYPEEVYAIWVHDYGDQNWIKADEAYFVVPGNIVTPMGHGLIAYSDRQEAKQTASRFGVEVLSLEKVLKVVETHPLLHKH
jgi:copper chaperone NosL|tara:strand:+ start:166 stop:630 length:465 start_codon:yes stop_codon:yes gene_type:complete